MDGTPAEEDVRRTLDHALSYHHASSLLSDCPFARDIGLQHRFTGFLDLQKYRAFTSLLLEQHNPAIGADAADANNLARDVNDPVARQQTPSVLGQRSEITS